MSSNPGRALLRACVRGFELEAAPCSAPWRAPDLWPRRPHRHPYGILTKQGYVPCEGPDDLVERHSQLRDRLGLVAVEEFEHMVPPTHVTWLRPSLLAAQLTSARNTAWLSAFNAVAWGAFTWGSASFWMLTVPLALLPLASSLVLLARGRRLGVGFIARRKELDSFALWVRARPRRATWSLLLALALVYVVQLAGASSLSAVGLVRPPEGGVRGAWRLLTHAFAHVGLLHFAMNAVALYVLGMVVEALAGAGAIFASFACGSAAGGALSLALLPAGVTVGASGGIMGFVGFLGAFALQRPALRAAGILRSSMVDLAVIAAFGAMAFEFVDNAAHAGGALGGALIGGLWGAMTDEALPARAPGALSGLATCSGVALFAAALFACARLLGA